MKTLNYIPSVPSRKRKTTGLIKIQVIIGIGICFAILAAIGIPLAVAFTQPENTTSGSTTTVTTVTTTTATTTTSTTATTTTATTATTTTVTTTTSTATTTTVTTTTSTATTTTVTTQTTTTITASLTAYGPQTNFDPATLSSAWSMCYSGQYSQPIFNNITSILSTCYKAKLLIGCRPVGNARLTLAAMGNRADVLYDCSATSTTVHVANGVAWFYATNTPNWSSWGFVLGTDGSFRHNCDGDMTNNPTLRLCWHMTLNGGGWRCGTTDNLDSSTTWEKVIFHAM